MNWTEAIVEKLADEIGPAPLRLLRAIIASAEEASTAEGMSLSAEKGVVLDRIRAEEGAELSEDALRRRIKQINDAAQTPEGPVLRVRSRKTRLVIDVPQQGAEESKRNAARDAAIRSTRADTEIDPSLYEEPRITRPTYQVFLSHGWEDPEVEDILDGFVEKLTGKLSNLPERFRDKFAIKLWFDRKDIRGNSQTFEAQTDPACQASRFALFMLSDKWLASSACRREFSFFEASPDRFHRIILSGDRSDFDRNIVAGPCFPALWNQKFPNLLALWSKGQPDDRDSFLTRLRNEICEALEKSPPPAPQPPPEKPSLRTRLASSALARDHHESVVREGKTEEPRVVDREGDTEGTPILPILTRWANDDKATNRLFAVLGSFGAGKTTMVQLFARELDLARKDDPKAPFPIYLDFRRLIGFEESASQKLADIIVRSLNLQESGDLDKEELLRIIRTEPCVIIFDGLDEVGTRLGAERAAQLLRDLLEIVPKAAWNGDQKDGAANWAACPTRLLVTCRTHFFRDVFDERAVLSGHYRQGVANTKSEQLVKTVYMAPFDLDQIKGFFCKTLGAEEGGRVFADIERIQDLVGLAAKPIMTRFIAELAPDLLVEKQEGRPINVATVYELLFRKALDRDSDKKPLLTVQDRQKLLEALAVMLWHRRSPTIGVAELEDWFDRYAVDQPGLQMVLSGDRQARNLLHTELRNASLLIREGESDFRFVHTSFFEFFLGRQLLKYVLEGSFGALSDLPPISREAWQFVVAQAEWSGKCDELIAAAKLCLTADFTVAQRKEIWWLRVALLQRGRKFSIPDGADLSYLPLGEGKFRGSDVKSAQLRRISFVGATLLGSDFSHVIFTGCDFDGAVLSQVTFEHCRFTACKGDPIGVESTRHFHSEADEESKRTLIAKSRFVFDRAKSDKAHPSKLRFQINVPQSDAIYDADCSSDGSRMVTASNDGTLRLWDMATGRLLRILGRLDDAVNSVRFSRDGEKVLIASSDGTARVLRVKTGEQITVFEEHIGPVDKAVYSPDETRILTTAADLTALLWDATTGQQIRIWADRDCPVNTADFSRDGDFVIAALMNKSARLWDSNTGELTRIFAGDEHINSIPGFSHDGRYLMAISEKKGLQLWDVESGQLERTLLGADMRISSMILSPDGTELLGVTGEMLCLIDAATGRLKRVLSEGEVGATLVFLPDGKRALSAPYFGPVRVRDLQSGQIVLLIEAEAGETGRAIFHPKGKAMLQTSLGYSVRLSNLNSGNQIREFKGHEGRISDAIFSSDGNRLLTASRDKTARLWNAETGEIICTFKGHEAPVTRVAISRDNKRVATISRDETVRIWNARTGEQEIEIDTGEGRIYSAEFSPLGDRILTASSDGTARLYDATTGDEVMVLDAHEDFVRRGVFSPDGTLIATASDDETARLWDVASGAMIRVLLGHTGFVQSVSFSPDSTRLLTAADDGTVRLWSVRTGKELALFRTRDAGQMTSAEFSPDSTRILATSSNGITSLWDVETGARLICHVALPNCWVRLDEQGEIIKGGGPDLWKHLHAIVTDEDGWPQVVCPPLEMITGD